MTLWQIVLLDSSWQSKYKIHPLSTPDVYGIWIHISPKHITVMVAPWASMTFPLQWHPKISQPNMPQPKSITPRNHQRLWRSETPYLHRSLLLLNACCPGECVSRVSSSNATSKGKKWFYSSLSRLLNTLVHIRLVLWITLNKERLMDRLSTCRVWGLNTFRPSGVTAEEVVSKKQSIHLLKLVWST